MINVKKGDLVIKGDIPELLTDITIAIRKIREAMIEETNEKHADEMFDKVWELSKMDPDEVHEHATKVMDEVVKDLLSDDEFMSDFREFLKSRGEE